MQALPAAYLMLAVLSPLGVAVSSTLAPPPGGPVAAVFPPWWDGARAIAAAGAAGPVLRFGAFPFVVVVLAADRGELRSRGAWLVLDPRAAGLCAQTPS